MSSNQDNNFEQELEAILWNVATNYSDYSGDKDSLTVEQAKAKIQSSLEEAVRLALVEPNSLLRSAYAIAKRDGKDTNWESFRKLLLKELEIEHKIMYPLAALTQKQGEK